MSNDEGGSWIERPVPFDARTGQGLYIAAVDPLDAHLVYLRTAGASSSRLLSSADAGESFEEHYAGGPMLGFALSPDGAEIYLGGVDDGLWVAARGELAFEQRSTLPIVCLAASAEALYACSNDRGGFALGVSRDRGQSFEPLLVLSELRGPLACAAGTSVEMCDEDWPGLRDRLGIPIEPEPLTSTGLPNLPSEPPVNAPERAPSGGCSLGPPVAGEPIPLRAWCIVIVFGVALRRALARGGRRRRRGAQGGGTSSISGSLQLLSNHGSSGP